jgi:hypothetical protein
VFTTRKSSFFAWAGEYLLRQAHFLLQLCVFGFGFFQDWDVGVGVFPEGEKVLVGDAGFRGFALHLVGAGELVGRREPFRISLGGRYFFSISM